MSGSHTATAPEEMTLDRETSEALWKMLSSGLLCDGLIKTSDGGAFPVHRVVMASFIRVYKRVIWVGTENVESVLEVTGYLYVSDLIKDCCEFLHSIMSLGKCISIDKVAKRYNCFVLESKTYRYRMQHFVEISKRSEEFFKLEINEVESLLSDENVNVVREKSVWKAALRWIEFNPANRVQHIARLLSCVRTGLVDLDFFVKKIQTHRYVAGNEACKPIVTDSLRFLHGPSVGARNDQVRTTPALARPRIPHELMFVIGGWMNGGPTTCIESYDSQADRWVKVESVDPAGPQAYHKCAVIGYDIYVIGDFNGQDFIRSVHCFNAHTKTWRSITPMHVKRGYVSVAVLNDIIYVMRGFDEREWQSSAETFDYRNNQWTVIASMNQQRSDACATAHNGYVYVTGGFSGSECLSSAERYDPEFDQWTAIASMRYRRSGIACIGFRDSIYAMGRFSGFFKLISVEKYSPETNTWTLLPNMHTAWSNFAVAVIDNIVFACGGLQDESETNRVSCYDPSSEQWYDATSMNEGRSAMAACVISGLPNVRDYVSYPRDNLRGEKCQKILDIFKANSRP
ncbi:hypothetical protein HPB48_023995 [Haemaphysalis longicornis]|uniref:BACK domain-containing protein n=1 Tax=Haemaphysalis longicornis TaxID=44386 RepID=A0A9J6H7Q2_HAELO|nr:hypothetical protein HPB48_023995 [Haemaphysalis longicornis]